MLRLHYRFNGSKFDKLKRLVLPKPFHQLQILDGTNYNDVSDGILQHVPPFLFIIFHFCNLFCTLFNVLKYTVASENKNVNAGL